jgi:uncharacterized membrane protein YidH (DUF202 family)
MDHRQYRELFLSADADAELSAAQRRAATEHLLSCEECRRYLAQERALKDLIRRSVPLMAAPAALRHRIGASLEELDETQRSRPGFPRLLLRHCVLVPAVALAALLLVILTPRAIPRHNPFFDAAIAAYRGTEASFNSNVPGDSISDFALAIDEAFGTPYGWDFSNIGLNLSGARIDHSTGGKPVAYGLYRGARGSLLTILTLSPALRIPSGGQVVKGIHIYKYKGFSIAVVRYENFSAIGDGGITCVMVSRLPPEVLAQAFNFLLPS